MPKSPMQSTLFSEMKVPEVRVNIVTEVPAPSVQALTADDIFFDFSDDAPVEFKTTFKQLYQSYRLCGETIKYASAIGGSIAGVLISITGIMKSTAADEHAQTIIAYLNMGVTYATTICVGVSQMIRASEAKQLENQIVKFGKYFKTFPNVDPVKATLVKPKEPTHTDEKINQVAIEGLTKRFIGR